MNSGPTIVEGSTVTLRFELSLEDGTIADKTDEEESLTIVMGNGELAQGLELALYGLRAGDKQRIALDPREAFGYPEEDRIHTLPRGDFDPDYDLEPGLIMAFSTADGDEVPGTILEVSDQKVKVDFNHPLAGHEVTFDVEILNVEPVTLNA